MTQSEICEDSQPRFREHLCLRIEAMLFHLFDGGQTISHFVPLSWELCVEDQFEYEFGDQSGIAQVIECKADPFCGKLLCKIKKVD